MFEETISIDGNLFIIRYGQLMTYGQWQSLKNQIRKSNNLFPVSEYNPYGIMDLGNLNTPDNDVKIEWLASPKVPPIGDNIIYSPISALGKLTGSIPELKKIDHRNNKTAIVLPCRNEIAVKTENTSEVNLILMTVNSILNTPTNVPFEIIIVDDGSTDKCCDIIRQNLANNTFNPYQVKLFTNISSIGACKARNLGADNASPDTNYICFCDAHITVEDYWLDRLIEAELDPGESRAIVTCGIGVMQGIDEGGFGETLNINELPRNNFVPLWLSKPATITEVPFAPGGCMLMTRQLYQDIDGFDKTFQTWGADDIEISIKAQLFGYKILVSPYTRIEHYFRDRHPYQVTQNNVDYNNIIMSINHFKPERIEKILKFNRARTDIDKIMTQILTSKEICGQRQIYLSKRKYTDDWFFSKFNIDF